MNPDLKFPGWHSLKVNYPPASSEETAMFIGRFKDDKYHVMGYIPDSVRAFFSEESESQGDHGIVALPEGRKNLSDLVNGDVFTFSPEDNEECPYAVKFLRFN